MKSTWYLQWFNCNSQNLGFLKKKKTFTPHFIDGTIKGVNIREPVKKLSDKFHLNILSSYIYKVKKQNVKERTYRQTNRWDDSYSGWSIKISHRNNEI